MKVCYIDESGTGDGLFAVMVGVIVDSYRGRITRKDWTNLLTQLSSIIGRPLREIHTSEFYSGNGIWRNLPGDKRARVINAIFSWLKVRNHKIVYTAVDRDKFDLDFHKEPYAKEIKSLWRFMALHLCLAIQKHHQRIRAYKGHTFLIFDNQKSEAADFIELIRNTPKWTDTYYTHEQNQDRLDQIIDVSYFGDSQHVGLIQLADFVSFFLRKHIEITAGIPPNYKDEPSRIKAWATTALNQSIPTSAMYPKIGRCECTDLFYRYAPSCLLDVVLPSLTPSSLPPCLSE